MPRSNRFRRQIPCWRDTPRGPPAARVCRSIGRSPEVAHQCQRHVDVWARNDFAFEHQCQPFAHHRCHHEQGRNVLRTDICRQRNATPLQRFAHHAQRRKSLVFAVRNVGAQRAQGIDQHPDGAFAHTFCTRKNMRFAGADAEVSRQKAHGCAGSHHIHHLGPEGQGTLHHPRIVAVRGVGYR